MFTITVDLLVFGSQISYILSPVTIDLQSVKLSFFAYHAFNNPYTDFKLDYS